MDQHAKDMEVMALYHELVEMAARCPKHAYDPERSVYLTLRGKPVARAAEIGWRLYALGGMTAMSKATAFIAYNGYIAD
eukprot:gene10456-8412_t